MRMVVRGLFAAMLVCSEFDACGGSGASPVHALRHGAEARVCVCVQDDEGNSVDGASVVVGFYYPKGTNNLREGLTDTNGMFCAEGKTLRELLFRVSKEGWYRTEGRYDYSSNTNMSSSDGRWDPWGVRIPVVLRRRVAPTGMYAKRVYLSIPVTNGILGFDCLKGDLVSPYGGGDTADLLFEYRNEVIDSWNFHKSLRISCSNETDGLRRLGTVMSGSEFRSAYGSAGDEEGGEVVFRFRRTTDAILDRDELGDSEYIGFRIRSRRGADGDVIGGLYGKIYNPVDYGLGPRGHYLGFTYYLNPEPGNRNLEFDPKQNLFKDLKPMERVREP